MSEDSERLFNIILDEYVASGCPGVILEVRSGEGVCFSGASGLFSRGDSRPLSVSDAFRAASVTKTVTAATVICLAQSGFWKLDDAIAEFLPSGVFELLSGFTGPHFLYDITIRKLLNHTSGLPDYFFNPRFRQLAEDKTDHIWEPVELIEAALDNGEILFPPGKGFSYGDTGYVLTGIAIEHMLDCDLSEAYRTYILDPLEMKSTYLEWRATPAPVDLSHHYEGEKDLYGFNLSFDWAGGGLVTTAGDLSCLLDGIFREKLFTREWLYEMTDFHEDTKWVKSSSARYIKYGLGIGTNLADGEEIIGSTGVWGAFAYFCPTYDTTVCGTLNVVGADRSNFMNLVLSVIRAIK